MFSDKKKFIISTSLLLIVIGGWHLYDSYRPENRKPASVKIKKQSPKKHAQVNSRRVLKKKAKRTPNSSKQQTRVVKKKLDHLIKDIHVTKKCYQTESCKYPNSDPKAYHFGVSLDLKKKLYTLHNFVMKNKIVNASIEKIAQEYLAVEDGHVKEAALHLISTQEISENSLNSLINDILSFHDAKLVPHAMLELQRYLGSTFEERVHKALVQAIQTGAPSVSQSITNNIRSFLSSKSIQTYQKGLTWISKKTNTYKKLKIMVDDFNKSLTAA